MADESVFRGVLSFFDRIGVYDVVLPFILVFTIVFAVLEKTNVLGKEKRNLNAMAAFVIAFLVIASGQLVQAITSISANVVILLLASVFFLMLVGSFVKPDKEGIFLEKGWKAIFMAIMFIGLIVIFLNAFTLSTGQTWLAAGWDYLVANWSSTVVGSIALVGGVALFIYFIVKSPSPKGEEKK